MPYTTTTIEKLAIEVFLGVTAEERNKPQTVWFDLSWQCPIVPAGCYSDKIADTHCYGTLSQLLIDYCKSNTFNLIEHLGWKCYEFCQTHLPPHTRIHLVVFKKPPIANLDRVSFEIRDHQT